MVGHSLRELMTSARTLLAARFWKPVFSDDDPRRHLDCSEEWMSGHVTRDCVPNAASIAIACKLDLSTDQVFHPPWGPVQKVETIS